MAGGVITVLTSVLYISRSRIEPNDADSIVKEIVASATVANQAHGLTGALLFTGQHFAQVIEGRAGDVDVLLDSLARDQRHDQLQIVERAQINRRRFKNWSMAYFGPSQFVARHVTRLLNEPSPFEQNRAAAWLTDLMMEFSKA